MNVGERSIIQYPIFIWDRADLSVYRDIVSAEQSMEPIDVRSGYFTAYDASGRALSFKVVSWVQKLLGIFPIRFERVAISVSESAPSHRNELAEILRHYLAVLGWAPERLAALDFDELVSAAVAAAEGR
jgi:hypothetical protein